MRALNEAELKMAMEYRWKVTTSGKEDQFFIVKTSMGFYICENQTMRVALQEGEIYATE